jgi:hypothetical protein
MCEIIFVADVRDHHQLLGSGVLCERSPCSAARGCRLTTAGDPLVWGSDVHQPVFEQADCPLWADVADGSSSHTGVDGWREEEGQVDLREGRQRAVGCRGRVRPRVPEARVRIRVDIGLANPLTRQI